MMQRFPYSVKKLLVAFICLCSWSISYSQVDTVQLKEVEVYGIKPNPSTRSAVPIQQMSIRQLEAIPMASVAEAIRNLSGVVIKDFGGVGGLKTVMVRSLGANHTGVFVDGIYTGDAATGQMDLGKIPLQDVGNIQLSIGQPEFNLAPARMFASASILDISSRKVDFMGKRNVLLASIRTGSFGTINPSLSMDSKVNKHLITGLRINYHRANGKFPYKVDNGTITTALKRENSDVSDFNAVFKASLLFNDSSSLKIKGQYYDTERGLPGAVIFYNTHSSQRLFNKDFIAGLQYENNSLKVVRLLTTTSFTYTRLIYTDPDFLNQSGGLNNEYNQQEYYVSQAATLPLFKKLNLSVATDLITNRLQTNAYSVENPTRITSLTAGSLEYTDRKTKIQGSILMTAVNDDSGDSLSKEYFKFSPSVSVIHSLTSNQTLKMRFMYKNIFRMPSFNDLYYTIAGNLKLEPEYASLYNFGFLFDKTLNNTTSISLKADGFINAVKDKIVTTPTQNLFRWSTQNIGKVDIKGVELFGGFEKRFNKSWSIEISSNYTYQHAKDITNKASVAYGHQIAYIPFETASGLVFIQYSNFGLGVNTIFNGYRYIRDADLTDNILESWATTDLTLSWQKSHLARKCGIKAEIANIFNHPYEVIKGFPMTGRAFFINLFVTF